MNATRSGLFQRRHKLLKCGEPPKVR